MNKIFNTPFETSLRALLVLGHNKERAMSLDMIVALDFATIYGESTGYASNDLHGQNPFGFSEYASKRELVSQSLRQLVMRGLVEMIKDENGISYKISKDGYYKVVLDLYGENDFAKEYVESLNQVAFMTKGKSEQQIIARISEKARQNNGGGHG